MGVGNHYNEKAMGFRFGSRSVMKKTFAYLVLFSGLIFFSAIVPAQEAVQAQLGKDKTFQNAFALISEADLYCSFFILEDIPRLRITASEKGGEKSLLADYDLFYIGKAAAVGLKEGQLMMVLEMGQKISSSGSKKILGSVAFKRGRARVVRLEKEMAAARLEKTCGPIMVGDFLVPFEEKEGLLGKDLGFDASARQDEALTGRIIFLDGKFTQIGPGQWALIDLGEENGIQVGRQLTVFHQGEKDLPLVAVGNVIVIHAGRSASTIKVLSAKDAVKIGDIVQVK